MNTDDTRDWLADAGVILNANARKVTRRIREKAEEIVPRTQLYFSESLDDARAYIQEMVERRTPTIVCGGGDGTIVSTINQIRQVLEEKNQAFKDAYDRMSFPNLAILRLGTGNAWGHLLESAKGVEPLAHLRNGDRVRLTRFNLVRDHQDTHFHFAGMGWDAKVLNDYQQMKTRFENVPVLRQWMIGLQGYFSTIFLKSIPDVLFRKQATIRVINEGEDVYSRVWGEEPVKLPVKYGETIYEGPTNAAGCATTPYYGFKLRAFPFSQERENFMNVRVMAASVTECLTHLRQIWNGTWRSNNVHDFLAQKVRFEFQEDTPYQIGGDAAGYLDQATFSVSDLTVNMLDFSPVKG